MSTDLFISQPVAQNASTRIQSDKIGTSGSERSAGIESFHDSPEGDRDNFLSTLKQVTQDRSPTQRPERAAGSPSDQTTPRESGDKIDDASGHGAAPADTSVQSEPDEQPDSVATEWNLASFIKLLETLGFNPAAETSDLQSMANANPADKDLTAAVESLIARLQQLQAGPAVDLKSGFEQLQQFISTSLRTADGVSIQGISSSQVNELAQINQWLKGLTAGLQAPPETFGLLKEESTAGVNSVGTIPVQAAGSAETVVNPHALNSSSAGVNSVEAIPVQAAGSAETVINPHALNGSSAGVATNHASEHSAVLSQSENRSEADPKFSTDHQSLVAKTDPDSKASPAVEISVADGSKTKEPMGDGRDLKHANRAELPGRIALAPDQDQAGLRDAPSVKPSASSGPDPAVVKMSESQNQSAAGAEPLSKVFQETQLLKEGGVKAASGSTEETVSKVIKTEPGSTDNGLLNSSGHNLQKAVEPAAVQKEIEAGQSGLRNQTLDQIVRQAAIHLRNGQHEAQIDLKPDFLGHIRLQVISANNQVTVKILAEHGFVKDMIESNFHQLKGDLQQQGLEVDKLEVTVSRDSEDSGNYKDKLAQSKARPNNADRQKEDPPAKEKKQETAAPVRTAKGAPTVDYFA